MFNLRKKIYQIFDIIIYFPFRMRPTTPMPNGCSFSLLTFRINFARPPPYTQGIKTNRVNNTQSKKILTKNKMSLKKPSQHSFQSFDNYQFSKMECSGIQNQLQNFFQFSSVAKHKNSRKEKKNRYQPESIYNNMKSTQSTQRGTQRTSLRPQKQNQIKNQLINVTQTNVFTDQITLNQQSGFHQAKRNQGVIVNNLHHKENQRRIHTENNNQVLIANQKHFNETNSRHNPQVTRSQFFNHENNFLHRSPTVSTLKKDTILSNQSQNQVEILRNSTIKMNSFFEAKVQPTVLSNKNIEKIPVNSIINQFQIRHEVSNVPLTFVNQSHDTHSTRKPQYSPNFEKKFKTLVDLTYKNVSSSGSGDKTSSNHISIVASQDSINQTNFGKASDGFSKKIKMMTLKSMPLKQEIWSMSLTKE